MRTVIAGGHGQIALRLQRQLAERGDSAVGLIRDPSQADDLRAVGGEPAVLDLESASVEDVAAVLTGADAAVFAAGAGPGSGAARKQTVDYAAAVLLADAAERAGVRRFLVVSSMGADARATGPDPVFTAYLRAKGQADDDIRARPSLDWTILRPGALTNDPGTGSVTLSPTSTGRGSVPREDVATVLAALLSTPATAGLTLELISGPTAVPDAVRKVAGS
ncbi:NAD(P)H-binding protein [Actinacidiphila acididurans]|uniref:NAD(P)H-binding protein n=1 Tax=Actinacidiphila acididurans TaxID=2784346 RepID=A0ABS2TN84_9ACTN|nr:NAD(P)H-binding protein [Actinacidiphila acididurans]MBM9504809.1 NAD(P)H-binding protein [Actinacidiphila acididurans]